MGCIADEVQKNIAATDAETRRRVSFELMRKGKTNFGFPQVQVNDNSVERFSSTTHQSVSIMGYKCMLE